MNAPTTAAETPTHSAHESRQLVEDSLLLAIVRPLRPHLRRIAIAAVAGFVLGVALSFAFTPRYRADAKVAVNAVGGDLSSAAAIASSFGVSIGDKSGFTPEFTVELLKSRQVVDPILASNVLREMPGRTPKSIAQYLLRTDDSLSRREFFDARAAFRARMSVDLDVRSGLISVSFWDHDPQIALRVVDSLVSGTDHQIVDFQRASARARRDYLSARVAEAADSLGRAEAALAAFRSTNRGMGNSPWLQLDADRLARHLSIAQERYASMRKQLDDAELDIRRDIPQLMVVESPIVPERKFFPKRSLFAAAFTLLAVALTLFRLDTWATVRDALIAHRS